MLDKAIEFNPNNQSFHPIEAKGTNQTDGDGRAASPVRRRSSSGTSRRQHDPLPELPRRQRKYDTTLPAPGGAARAPATTSPRMRTSRGPRRPRVPGILIQTYQYGSLNAPTEDYAASDFALCYTCHAEAPFKDTTGDALRTDTNFRYHGLHVSGSQARVPRARTSTRPMTAVAWRSAPSATSGSTRPPTPTGGQGSYQRLVNFAPNVTDSGSATAPVGANAWDQNAKTCTLTCHGQDHGPKGY